MFDQIKTIIYLKRSTLEIHKLNNSGKTLMKAEVPWNKDDLESILKDIPNTFKVKEIRLLLDTSICYAMILPLKEITVPKRKEVRSMVSGIVPEKLENEWWDYKILITKDEKKILFFAPVVEIYKQFINAIQKTNLILEGTYPLEFLPKTDNDFAAFAKISLNGKDEDTLGLIPPKAQGGIDFAEENKEDKPLVEGRKESKSKVPQLLGLLGILILLLIAVILQKSSNSKKMLSPTSELKEVVSEPTAVPTVEIVPLDSFSVLIMNSTKTTGLANRAKEALLAEGFTNIETDNATEAAQFSSVAMKTGISQSVYKDIIRALNSDFEFESDLVELSTENQYDVVVTLGERKEVAQ
ncbi:MAG: hypothetical protein AUK08_03265 [Candidatus Pacebacteria bacterium CG2_30_36_39]|nr:MAG: hypothetical protein AUK08_03265 [Candidatus Pacebacteria bacterium CG2_30_36_39]